MECLGTFSFLVVALIPFRDIGATKHTYTSKRKYPVEWTVDDSTHFEKRPLCLDGVVVTMSGFASIRGRLCIGSIPVRDKHDFFHVRCVSKVMLHSVRL